MYVCIEEGKMEGGGNEGEGGMMVGREGGREGGREEGEGEGGRMEGGREGRREGGGEGEGERKGEAGRGKGGRKEGGREGRRKGDSRLGITRRIHRLAGTGLPGRVDRPAGTYIRQAGRRVGTYIRCQCSNITSRPRLPVHISQ